MKIAYVRTGGRGGGSQTNAYALRTGGEGGGGWKIGIFLRTYFMDGPFTYMSNVVHF